MAKTEKQLKKEQANMQSDNMEMAGWSEGLTMSSNDVETTSIDLEQTDFNQTDFTYSFGDLGQLDLFSEEDMREKYPALKQAHEHYQSVLEVCKTKEKEENEN
tara:strand:- start:712 stop:1020 length:309 start_codon:yes stop_codon:yes gene_type:complete